MCVHVLFFGSRILGGFFWGFSVALDAGAPSSRCGAGRNGPTFVSSSDVRGVPDGLGYVD